jgi:hypothetical protein
LGERDGDALGRGAMGVPGAVGAPANAATGTGTPPEGGLGDGELPARGRADAPLLGLAGALAVATGPSPM